MKLHPKQRLDCDEEAGFFCCYCATLGDPCKGFFVQGGVKAVAIVDFSVSVILIVITALGIEIYVKKEKWEAEQKDWRQYAIPLCWAYFCLYQVIILIMSPILYSISGKRNEKYCRIYFRVSMILYIIWIVIDIAYSCNGFSNIINQVLYYSVAIHRGFALWVIHRFLKELKSLGTLNETLRCLTDAEVQEFLSGRNSSIVCPRQTGGDNEDFRRLPYNKAFEIEEARLDIDDENPIGSGAFGTVHLARLKADNQNGCRTVAVKILNAEAGIHHFKAVLSELKIMTNIGQHPNIVNLIGACTSSIRERKLLIVVEFCPLGNMKYFLQTHRTLFVNQINEDAVQPAYICMDQDEMNTAAIVTTTDLLKWSCQLAKGMEYLASKRIIHGDLAARNILLSRDKTIKISDFGLSKQLYEHSVYIKTEDDPLPWRWLAIESLIDLSFSTASDIWAFGVTLWEFFSLANAPYAGVRLSTEFVQDLKDGVRLPKPEFATNEIYDLMLDCWKLNGDERPSFTQIVTFFDERVQKYSVHYDYFKL